MKLTLSLLVLLAVGLISSCATSKNPPLATVPKVDVKRYAGLWHEVARLPNSFQRDNAKATAYYTVQGDGSIEVVNTEYRPDGSTKVATGTAKAVPDGRNSRLRVEFNGWGALAPNPKEGNYWIVDLAPDYSVALVGTPNRKYLWLLSRSAHLPKAKRDAYVQKARELGFPTDKLLYAN